MPEYKLCLFHFSVYLSMKIQEMSKITTLSAHTLRYYEKIGLLRNVKRDSGGHRYYSDSDLIWIEFIKRLKATNMPLTEIERFAVLRTRGDKTISERVAILKHHEARISRQMEELKFHKMKVREKIKLCIKGSQTK